MWTTIKYVSSGITLIAFLGALAAWLYKSHLLKTERLIKTVPEAERASLVEQTLLLFKLEPAKLTREQRYNLALRQIHEHARRYRVTAFVVIIIAILAATLTFIALWRTTSSPNTPPSSAQTPPPAPTNLSGEIDQVEVM